MYANFFKRVIDIVVAALVLVIMSPVFLLIAILIPVTSRGPVFFRQERVGKGLKPISVLKFRTMTDEPRTVGNKPVIGRAEGVTRIGYWLRRFKLDEFPQLMSVLKGDMSLVGPRPSVRKQLKNMTQKEKQRYGVRPGLTGLAQVTGNIHLRWKERYKKDLIYIKNITLLNDLKILLRTVMLIFRGEQYYKNKPLFLKNNNYE